MADDVVVYVADAGSVSKDNFHWVSSGSAKQSSTSPRHLAEAIANDLKAGLRVALGYESPLFVPVDPDASLLGKRRDGECLEATGNRPFTAAAGATALATGIQSLAWVLRETKILVPSADASTRWIDFRTGACRLFVWEAFVSGSEKAYPPSHAGDAALAISAFQQVSSSDESPTCIPCRHTFSLVGSAIVWSGLSDDLGLLAEPCVVIRPLFSKEEGQGRLSGYKLRQAEAKKAKAAKMKGGGW